MSPTSAIWWIRRDLRVGDNQALTAAFQQSTQVLPVFILDQKILHGRNASQKRNAFLFANLRSLNTSLEQIGGRLIIRQGDPKAVLSSLMEESGAQMVFVEPDYTPYALSRDRSLTEQLPVHWYGSPLVHPPGSVLRSDRSPYTVFTPFSKAWKALALPPAKSLLPAPQHLATPGSIASLPIPDQPVIPAGILFQPGEQHAQEQLRRFIEGDDPPVYHYATQRDFPAVAGTSSLSPYLRFGVLSARQAAAAAQAAIEAAHTSEQRRSAETWLNELIWREFYGHILFHFPHVLQRNFRLMAIRWQNDPAAYAAWREGRTGYPLVDAGMRQLTQTGWMHNRLRMLAASFLTKDLLIDWRWGERFFMQHLLDGDPASNNGGWQWTAGTGTDAAPYFRIFNPSTQSAKFDPSGEFIRQWLPELARVPLEFIHQPETMPSEIQRQAGCIIGKDYPAPIVDHAWARQRALQVYGQAK
jgi:deoxyribodipyrimidine photo-lyase